ncbi:phosphatidylserine decarboxylase [Candidatus Phytoplasma melaleucae]|uniref:Phosphatidylserine decarboxylase n=1 Tax=Candidatus Phytoplasma melaleucae TaxID=2982630 RepID=A0ABT9DE02_9MOLU|nr:phosphatidylserine decarboxylase ['Melaleuca sp.' phytoplasma]MDO8168049.1 phosphatidylserine decarboxylase ['Melaleuca sp.' phytoplasma]MDV3205330.1 phosphatidylserine decarboxylase [Weeping tea tree witches'-broom phytoplasma]
MKKTTKINKNNTDPKITSLKQKILYHKIRKNWFKRFLLKIIVSKFFTKIISVYLKSPVSRIHINKMIKKTNIDINLFCKSEFYSYNDFFTRQYKKINFSKCSDDFISPGEGEICIYPINKKSIYNIKNTKYHLNDLLKNSRLADEYVNGFLVLLRLKDTDYHRYIFIDNGYQNKNTYKIKGKLHTVNPIAFQYFNVFKENSREYNILHTQNFGQIIQIEIGALLVGKINNHNIIHFKKGQEKGFFSFGGSTIVLLVKQDKVSFDQKIIKNTQNNKETKINIGEKIGLKI